MSSLTLTVSTSAHSIFKKHNVQHQNVEYKEIKKDFFNAMRTLLIQNIDRNNMDQNYKTRQYLKIECENCMAPAVDIYTECESIKRIKVLLTTYKQLMTHKKWHNASFISIFTFKDIYQSQQLYNDFLHIQCHIKHTNYGHKLHQRFKEDFQCINFSKFHRSRRNRPLFSKSQSDLLIDTEEAVFRQQCDTIHSYLTHYQTDVQRPLSSEYIGQKQTDEWFNIFDCTAQMNKDTIYSQLKENMGTFRWQNCHGFNSAQHHGLMHLKAKYQHIKEEVLYNPYWSLSKDNWNQTFRKAAIFHNSFARQYIKTTKDGIYDDRITQKVAQWKKDEMINKAEIIIFKLYTDYDKLQYELKKCFRFETKEGRYELEERLRTFYYLRINLSMIVHKYSRELDANMRLYHGVNAKKILSNERGRGFYGPLSTSTSYHVARAFATTKGMVLQITTSFPRLNCARAMDASVLSDYPEEKEWLIGFAYLRITSVITRSLSKRCNTFEDIDNMADGDISLSFKANDIFFAVQLFQEEMFSMSVHLEYWVSAYLYLQCGYNKIIKRNKFVDVLRDIFDDDLKYCGNQELYRYHEILRVLWHKFKEWRETKSVVRINEISDNLKAYFMDDAGFDLHKNKKYVISFKKIVKIFPNVREIQFVNQCCFDDDIVSTLIQYLLRNMNDKLKKIKFLYYDNVQYCDELDEALSDRLSAMGCAIRYRNIGKTGYEICIRMEWKGFLKKVASSITAELEEVYKKQNCEMKIPPKLCNMIITAIDKKIPMDIIYDYMMKLAALHKNNDFYPSNDGRKPVKIYDFGFCDKTTSLRIYCVAQALKKDIKQYKWGMMDRLFTEDDICDEFDINDSHRLLKLRPKVVSESDRTKAVEALLNNKICMQSLVNKDTKWGNVAINNRKQHHYRFTVSLTKPQFMKELNERMISTLSIRMAIPDIDNGNIIGHHTEYLQIIRMQKHKEGIKDMEYSIGIAYRYNCERKTLKAVGIHLDKHFILCQHLLISDCVDCHCLDDFAESHIEHLFIGDPDKHENNSKLFKKEKNTLKKEIQKMKNQVKAIKKSNKVDGIMKNNQRSKPKISKQRKRKKKSNNAPNGLNVAAPAFKPRKMEAIVE